MSHTRFTIDIEKNKISIVCFGSGPVKLLALPGYGNAADYFHRLFPLLETKVQIYAVDLPMHGETKWNDADFKVDHLLKIINKVNIHNQSPLDGFLGYSMGGRLVLSMLPHLKFPIKYCFLLAPDGLYTPGSQLWEKLPFFLKKRLVKLLNKPKATKKIAQLLRHAKIIRRSDQLFLERQMVFPGRYRRLLFWGVNTARFDVDETLTIDWLNKHNVKTTLIYGDLDKVVSSEKGKTFTGKLKDGEMIIISGNHHIVKAETAKIIEKVLTIPPNLS